MHKILDRKKHDPKYVSTAVGRSIVSNQSPENPNQGLAILPVYLVIDKSWSMTQQGKIEAANRFIPSILDILESKPTVNDKIRLSLISFHDEAEVVIPLGTKENFHPLPEVDASDGGGTDFGRAFSLLRSELESGVRALKGDGYKVYRPAVFLITDGAPTDPYESRMDAFSELTDPGFLASPNIVCLGVGDATGDVLTPYIHKGGKAIIAKDGVDPAAAIDSMVPIFVRSIVASTVGGAEDALFTMDLDALDDGLEVYG